MLNRNPWNNECEVCYSKHPFKTGEWMFEVLHSFCPDEPIIVCKICLFRDNSKVLNKAIFPVVVQPENVVK